MSSPDYGVYNLARMVGVRVKKNRYGRYVIMDADGTCISASMDLRQCVDTLMVLNRYNCEMLLAEKEGCIDVE